MIWQYLALLAVHWFGDFVLQTHWQASNKSKNELALLRHVVSYSACLALGTLTLFGPSWKWLVFSMSNLTLHYYTDYCTSRASSKLYAKQDWHNFFVVIGFDQLIHQATLAVTMWWLLT